MAGYECLCVCYFLGVEVWSGVEGWMFGKVCFVEWCEIVGML